MIQLLTTSKRIIICETPPCAFNVFSFLCVISRFFQGLEKWLQSYFIWVKMSWIVLLLNWSHILLVSYQLRLELGSKQVKLKEEQAILAEWNRKKKRDNNGTRGKLKFHENQAMMMRKDKIIWSPSRSSRLTCWRNEYLKEIWMVFKDSWIILNYFEMFYSFWHLNFEWIGERKELKNGIHC